MPIVINKAAVRRSLEKWCIASRCGETIGIRETAELSSHEVAAMSSDYFYDLLCADEDTVHPSTPEPIDLIAGEDIAAGQLLVIDADGKVTGFVGETTGDALPPIEEPVAVVEKTSRKRTKPVESTADDFFG